jgi:hypothetical protein
MGTENKKNVQFVISHLEGCSGNFLGYLAVSAKPQNSHRVFRVDTNFNEQVLSLNGRTTWNTEVDQQLKSHSVIVTHNYDRLQIQETFPSARLIQLYPYTHIGNVLYNICFKKLNLKLTNVIDNHFLDISIWFNRLNQEKPNYLCTNVWALRSIEEIENLLGSVLSSGQIEFFNQYWEEQLQYELTLPLEPMSIASLIELWKIKNDFSPWLIAWTIFVYEHINGLQESDRHWSINDSSNFESWTSLQRIESNYRTH